MPSNDRRFRRLLLTRLLYAGLLLLTVFPLIARPGWAAPMEGGGEAPKREAGASSPWFETEQGRVRLIAGAGGVEKRSGLDLGLEFRMAEGWKIYWRSPGDAGFPPRIDWAGSTNLAGAELLWPAPRRFTVEGLETIGYEEPVVLPIDAKLEKPGKPVSLRAAVDFLTCKELCVPYTAKLALDLPVRAKGKGEGEAALIGSFRRLVPRSAGALGIGEVALLPGAAPLLRVDITASRPLGAPDLFVEGPAGLAFSAPKREAGTDPNRARLLLPVSGEAAAIAALPGQNLRLTVVDGMEALDRTAPVVAGPPAPAPAPAPATATSAQGSGAQGSAGAPAERAPIGGMLLIALLGGFILNLMPCVLPVLSIKLLGVINHAGRSRAAVRLGFVATAAGIVASFLGLATAMILLKQAGWAVGWGLQFQQPVFLVVMSLLLAVFAANLFGFFEIRLPGFLADFVAAAERPGASLFVENFATGVFATLLATPCTAPYLGTAIGFALAGSTAEILAIFFALGLGLSMPYLAVAAVPRLVGLLPKPGGWMINFKRVLGALFALTSIWLLTVLMGQSGYFAAKPQQQAAGTAPAARSGWQDFDLAAIDRQVKAGRVVLVDVTADWCINCKVNESLVLGSTAVQDRLAKGHVVTMRADWTRPDETISRYLQSFGRYGIPFNAVYGPAAPRGLPLPEILTESAVLDALEKAGG